MLANARKVCPPSQTSKHSVPCCLHTAKYWVLICLGSTILGAIFNVVGNGGKVASPMHLPGGSANAALLLASAGLATAYAKQGIRVNAVSPGPTLTERLDTGITNDARVANISKETALARMVERIPMGRIASPEEVADAVVFLASSRASYITGVNIMMDGSLVPLI